MILHHPSPYIGKSPECLASDWKIWQKQFILIRQLIAIESEYINNYIKKYQYQKCNICQEFIELSLDVFHQVRFA